MFSWGLNQRKEDCQSAVHTLEFPETSNLLRSHDPEKERINESVLSVVSNERLAMKENDSAFMTVAHDSRLALITEIETASYAP